VLGVFPGREQRGVGIRAAALLSFPVTHPAEFGYGLVDYSQVDMLGFVANPSTLE
jgi:hypothetical protein